MLMFFSAFVAVSVANPQAAKQAEADPVVCVRPSDSDTHSVGTRMRPKKVCKRKSEWAVPDAGTRRDQNQAKPVTAPVPGGDRQ
jgi:hypothetical protein